MKIKTKDNFALDAVFNQFGNSQAGVIFAHGLTVAKDDEGIFVRAAKKLRELGLTTIRFDFRAHGKSQGDSVNDLTISGELTDLEAIGSFMENQGVKKLGLAGASFGGGISALYAGRHPNKIKALFLANPVLDYDKTFLNPTTLWAREHFDNLFELINQNGYLKIGSKQFKVGKNLFEEMRDYHPDQELKKYLSPLLIAQGSQDRKVASEDVVDCYHALPNPNKEIALLKDANHGFHQEPFETQVWEMIVEFFNQHLR